MHKVLVNRFGGLSLSRKSVVRLTDRPNMTLDVYCGRKTTTQPQQKIHCKVFYNLIFIPGVLTCLFLEQKVLSFKSKVEFSHISFSKKHSLSVGILYLGGYGHVIMQ